MSRWRKFSEQFLHLAKLAIPWLPGISAPGQSLQSFSVTGTGADPLAVTFAGTYINGQELVNMADATYQIFLSGDFAGAVEITEASKTALGFNITGLALNEVAYILVVGRYVDMPDPQG